MQTVDNSYCANVASSIGAMPSASMSCSIYWGACPPPPPPPPPATPPAPSCTDLYSAAVCGLYGGGNASGINRLPDPEGAAYWQSRFDSGLKGTDLNDAFHGGIKNSDCAIAPTGGFCN